MNNKENPKGFVQYWWFRYAMATELYIVEKWEQATIHVILALMFVGLWYINSTYVLAFVARLMSNEPSVAAAAANAGAQQQQQYPATTSTLIVDSISSGGITS